MTASRLEQIHIGAQLQNLMCIIAAKMFWKIYFLYDFWCAQTCSFRAVFGLPIGTLTILMSALQRRAKKKLYRCTSTFSALNCCGGIFFKSLSYIYTKSCAQTFPPIFDRNIAKLVAPTSNQNENYVLHLKE